MELLLASKSPRRQELLRLLTNYFTVVDAHVDEAGVVAESPALLAKQLAFAKAKAAANAHPSCAVIGCDTVVDYNGCVLGKPRDRAQAEVMLHTLSGNVHQVHTGVCILLPQLCQPASLFVETTNVHFAEIPPEEIHAYTSTDEPYDKAGGYGIQGSMARFIPRIEGCYYTVMGLPVAELYKQLKRHSIL